ncbi:hypothetical protein CTE05_37350 [Cellulomonas terrae]|uniref:Uncharacterized protein n=1 Tax=Cellulomonas terrae TaxID=311234 RepID=A0A511JQ92_9CELL|nr:hypothetical protein CTE05_37350 [Cellulomonas terrae]
MHRGGVGGLRLERVEVAHLRRERVGLALLRRGLRGGHAVLAFRPRPRTSGAPDHEDGGDDGDDAARGSTDGVLQCVRRSRSASKGNRHPAPPAARRRPPPSGGTVLGRLKRSG